jgi:RNA polymerase sigma factor (sigma-70 family)
LRAVAYRMLGSSSEADDALQECWLRLSRTGTGGIQNLGGWLTTVVAQVCLDMLRSRKSWHEEPLGTHAPEPIVSADGIDPEHEALLADSIGPALLVVLETLAPAERVAFVLHDMFAVPFNQVAPILGRSPTTARQLASRARRRVRGGGKTTMPISLVRGKSSTPSSLPHVTAISTHFSQCSTRASCSEPMTKPCVWARRVRSEERRPWLILSRAGLRRHNLRSSMEPREPRGLRAGGRAWYSASRSCMGKSLESTCSQTPSTSGRSTWRFSMANGPMG